MYMQDQSPQNNFDQINEKNVIDIDIGGRQASISPKSNSISAPIENPKDRVNSLVDIDGQLKDGHDNTQFSWISKAS